ncbi:phosphopantetheine attachment domain protein [Streptomyces sp. RLB3-17]|uniref:phosphopantetheine-binding protein n=1 Tax=Streptomyces TaxID=1883 RepID=UPI0011625611|nr:MULTISPECIES: phosphopantetheine-binding protein [unclassified Streptomyces]QDN54677.1 phosphopantetheine attachment domain protein [Streptomyces sp. S1D4-20]QDN64858.1 phosphopantetheine attachment domain protein [Streptomyces sp. S1D4-14]QDO37266.1 phosphopantetheine attachment domain protein [Streptomyces sp. RLB3-17]QDO47265.1 phosphopantetheine attachment domain protein [Streptomyces sp. RLB3-5]QDO57505.1 phosphopantetheine attachment domain protein [Streptomyces sp. RLB1-8]
MPAPLTLEGFRADLAEFLYQRPDEVDLEENPMDAGLDSLRIVTLLERWRETGAEVTFVELAERTSFAQWWQLLSVQQRGADHADA